MTKLNELAPAPGSTKNRMRIGRGPGSGKGKTGGRGVKGQKSRTGHGMQQFEGGQMPLHMRMPKRGFNNPFAKKLVEVNLWRIAQAIDAGKLDASQPITAEALLAAGVIRRERDGVRLLGEGVVSGKLDISCHSATASARKAIEAAGGKLTTKITPAAAEGDTASTEG
jgi:large subunit ribosomal protein L15